MRKVEIQSAIEYNDVCNWCTLEFGAMGNRWNTYCPPWKGYGLLFNKIEDYTLFMLIFGTDLNSLTVKL